MKTAIKLFVAIFFILAAVRITEAQPFSVSGTVRYADNNEIVTAGTVKLYNSDGVLESTTIINMQGDYILWLHRYFQNQDVIGFPNIEPEMNFVPTGYPDKIDPALFTQIDVTGNMTGIDLYVQRTSGSGGRPGVTTTISGIVLSNNVPVRDAIVYAKQGNDYVGFGISNSKGEYKINNIIVGDYELISHKIGSISESKVITISEDIKNRINFSLNSKSNGLANTNPFEFALTQNYPNPFNPSTVISYSLANEGFVTLKVYNNIGQQVAELVNTNQSAGIYNVTFNSATLSSGVYFYRLVVNSLGDANGFTDTKKMLMIK